MNSIHSASLRISLAGQTDEIDLSIAFSGQNSFGYVALNSQLGSDGKRVKLYVDSRHCYHLGCLRRVASKEITLNQKRLSIRKEKALFP